MTECVVIGAGIIGVNVAYRLAQQGASVTLVDAAMPGSGTTGTSGSLVGANEKRPLHYHQLGVRSMNAMRRLAGEFEGAPWFLATGHLEWANSPTTMAALDERVGRLQAWGYPVTWMSPAAVESDLEPELRIPSDVERVAYFSDDSTIYPHLLLALMLRRLRAVGVDCRFGVGPAKVQVARGRVAGIRLGDGDHIGADVVVCCAGRWTTEVLAPLGVSVPLVSPWDATPEALGFQVITTPVPVDVNRMVRMPGLSIRPAGGGRLMLHGRAEEAEFHVSGPASGITWDRPMRPIPPQAQSLLRKAKTVVPLAAGASVQSAVASVRALPVDGYPVVGWVPGHDGVYVAVTHSGIGLGALLGELTAEEIGGRPVSYLDPYRPQRFVDGVDAAASPMRKPANRHAPTN